MRPGFQKAVGAITDATDSVMDDELRAMAAAKAPPKVEVEVEGGEEAPEAGEFTPDEVARLKAMLAAEEV